MDWRRFCVAITACFAAAASNAPARAAAAPVQQAATVPTPADLGALPFLTGPELSPDGRHLAAKGLSGGKQVVLIVDLSSEKISLSKLNLPEGTSSNGCAGPATSASSSASAAPTRCSAKTSASLGW